MPDQELTWTQRYESIPTVGGKVAFVLGSVAIWAVFVAITAGLFFFACWCLVQIGRGFMELYS